MGFPPNKDFPKAVQRAKQLGLRGKKTCFFKPCHVLSISYLHYKIHNSIPLAFSFSITKWPLGNPSFLLHMTTDSLFQVLNEETQIGVHELFQNFQVNEKNIWDLDICYPLNIEGPGLGAHVLTSFIEICLFLKVIILLKTIS